MFYLALIGIVFIGVCVGYVAGVMLIDAAAGIHYSIQKSTPKNSSSSMPLYSQAIGRADRQKPHFAAADQSSSPH